MVIAKGRKTYIKKLTKEHINYMQSWGRHRDPLFYCYNFPRMNAREKEYWYSTKVTLFTKKCFVVYNNEDKLVGYISLRDIKIFSRTGVLGIVFDPNKVDKGYGTDALRAFLTYYFERLKMDKIYLKVAVFNERAQKCYEKSGFKPINIVCEDFEDQRLPVFTEDYFIPYRQFFKRQKTGLKCEYINMVLTKDFYFANRQNYPHYPPKSCV